MNRFCRTTALVLAAAMAMSFAACSSKNSKGEMSQSKTVVTELTDMPISTTVTTQLTIASTTTTLIPQTTPIPSTTESSQHTTTITEPTTFPETTRPPVTTTVPETTRPPVTTTVPETTRPPVTTTVPETTRPPVTTTIPETTPPVTQPEGGEPTTRPVVEYDDFKAMWISQYDLLQIYTAGGVQRDQTDFTRRIQTILDNVKDLGFNTVILQIRPNADSMYPSEYYPMSTYVVGKYGREASYDPVEIMVAEAHKRDLSIHAWINPLRAMRASEITLIDSKYPIRCWYDDPTLNGKYIVLYSGQYYLNPAYEEVRQLIIDGASEALRKYQFDGLHMDDYFYPTTASSFDAQAYSEYKSAGGTLSLADFRRDALNQLVAGLYAATKAQGASLRYGISPGGTYDVAYNEQYADFYTWCANEGYIDYICPQIYFGLEHQTYPFTKLCDVFRDMIKVDSVELIIGMTFGKAQSGVDNWAGSGKNEWSEQKDILKRCLEYTRSLEHCSGVAVFCYQYFYDPLTEQPVPEIAQERENFIPLFKEITWE